MYAFNNGLIVGRFQSFHIGHQQMIQKALDMCETVFVFIGSAQESGTPKNPFSYTMRSACVSTVFYDAVVKGRLIIRPLNDIGVGDNEVWGKYVMEMAKATFGITPDVIISGMEACRTSWFDDAISKVYIAKTIDVSASKMRDALLREDEVYWKQHTPDKLWNKYDTLRAILLDAQVNQATTN